MKILIIRNFPSYFSVTKNNTYNIQEIGLAKALVRKGHYCDIVFWTDKEEEIVEYTFDRNLGFRIFYRHGCTALKNTILRIDDLVANYDIIQPCEYNQIQSWILAQKYPNKTIIYHGPYYSDFNKNYNRMCMLFDVFFLRRYKNLHTPFIVKSKLAKSFLQNKGLSCVTDVGVGIDAQVLSCDEIHCEEPVYKALSHYHGIKLLYIGRLESRRNIEFLFKLLAVLTKKKQTKLFIVGNGDKKYVENVFRLAKEMKIENNIVWQPKMEQKYMSCVYRLADYFLLPTYYEIFGMVLLEAMYFGKVVLTTHNGGSSMLITDKENGYILPQNDISVWVDTIVCLEENIKLKEDVGATASKTIADLFTWDKLVDVFIDAYSKVGRNR